MAMSLQEQIRLLSMVDVLGPLSPEELEDLAKHTPDTYLEQGDVLYTPQQGTEATERLFILKKGRVQVYYISQDGQEITISVVEDGAVFGEMSLAGQSLQGVYVRALASSTVVSLRRKELQELIRRNPEVGLRLVDVLAKRLHAAELRYAGVVGKDVPARLANLILTLVDSEGLVTDESYRIPTRYTQEQLASMIGCKRVAVSRAFAGLKEVGAVQLKDRHIIVKDLDPLKSLAGAS
jgi:CRP/FNR family transcriptional regulator, cyclic AMP receptor protein